nr:cytochrome c biogenesis protein ResB [uncultured Holophaga sp.]
MSRRKTRPQPVPFSFWRALCSVRLTLGLLLVIAAASVSGTLIQQNLPREDYFRAWQDGTARFLLGSGLTDVYHSWWFMGLLLLLAINLIACSINRLPGILAAYRGQPDLSQEQMKAQPFHRSYVMGSSLEEARAGARQALLGTFRQDGGGQSVLYASRGAYARWGVMVVHASLLVIFLGAIIGALWGFKGYVNIVEGSSARAIQLRGGGDEGEGSRALPFELHVDSFKVSHYDTGQPSDFVSHVRVLEGGRTVREKDLRVNDPLNYRGITFYQASYGPAPQATFLLQDGKGGRVTPVSMGLGEVRELEGGPALAFDGFDEDFRGMGPAFQLRIQSPGQEARQLLLFQRMPDYDRQRGDRWLLQVGDFQVRQYTGLQVARDPGVPWVWTGCALMILGMMGAFFSAHRQVWVRFEACPEGVRCTLAGSTSRNRLAFEREFRTLLERMGAPEASKIREDRA